jgi:tetratricopeptide (TPR) repeat protein
MFAPPPPPPPAPPPSISIARLYEQPAERAFINGLRFYEEGQYERAEVLLKRSLAEGLHDRNDIAIAQKHLAFIACAYSRPADCEQAFRAAFAADPAFRLTDAEVGHPLWGPMYKRVAAEQPAQPTPPQAKQ